MEVRVRTPKSTWRVKKDMMCVIQQLKTIRQLKKEKKVRHEETI